MWVNSWKRQITMEAVTLMIYFMMGILIVSIIFVAFRTGRAYMKGKKLYIKVPKLRSRAILRDEQRFGSAMVAGYEPAGGLNAGYVYLVAQDGRRFKQFYHNDELIADNAMQAMAGAERAVWRVNYQNYVDKPSLSNETDELGQKNIKLKDELQIRKVETKQKLNEASTIPDTLQEVIREMSKPRAGSVEVVQKR